MNEVPQLVSAMLAIAFAAVMLVVGQLYIQTRPEQLTATSALTASVPVDPATAGVNRRAVFSDLDPNSSSNRRRARYF
jgi:hypothetical protein